MGKTRKSKWRRKTQNLHLDPSSVTKKMEKEQHIKQSKKFVEKNLDKLYVVSKSQDMQGVRLKRENEKKNQKSKNEIKMIKKIIKKSKQKTNKAIKKKKTDPFAVAEDIWEIKTNKKKDLLKKLVVNPAVIKPNSGESYNPTQESHTKAMKKLVKKHNPKMSNKLKSYLHKRKQKRREKIRNILADTQKQKKIKKMNKNELANHLKA